MRGGGLHPAAKVHHARRRRNVQFWKQIVNGQAPPSPKSRRPYSQADAVARAEGFADAMQKQRVLEKAQHVAKLYQDVDWVKVEIKHAILDGSAIMCVPVSASVAEALVQACCQIDGAHLPHTTLRYGGTDLNLGDTLVDHGVENGAVMYLVESCCDTKQVLHQLHLKSIELAAPAPSRCQQLASCFRCARQQGRGTPDVACDTKNRDTESQKAAGICLQPVGNSSIDMGVDVGSEEVVDDDDADARDAGLTSANGIELQIAAVPFMSEENVDASDEKSGPDHNMAFDMEIHVNSMAQESRNATHIDQ